METDNVSAHSSAKKKENSEDQQQRSIRFKLELKESNDKYFPEFSFKELLRTALVSIFLWDFSTSSSPFSAFFTISAEQHGQSNFGFTDITSQVKLCC